VGHAVHELVRGHAVERQRFRLLRRDAVRNAGQVVDVHDRVVGPTAGLDDRADPLADLEVAVPVRAVAERLDDPDIVVPEHERERRHARVATAPHLLLGERDTRRLDPDQRLMGARLRELAGPEHERLRLAQGREDDFVSFHDLTLVIGSNRC
jgi:hypothetical protein